MQEAASNFDDQVHKLHELKASVADDLSVVVKEIAQTGYNPQNILTDIIKLARLLDISAPAPRTTASTIADPRYNLLEYIKRHANSSVLREIHGDEILFDRKKPFTCISQIQEIFEDVSEKLTHNFTKQAEYA